MSERKVQIVSLNFVTGEIGYRVNGVELTYLVYVSPEDAQNQDVVNDAIRGHLASFEPLTAEMLGVELPQIAVEVPVALPPAEELVEI